MPAKYTERSMLKYTKKVIDLFQNPKNVGEMENPTVVATEGDPTCGDMLKMSLKIEGDKIVDAKFRSFGCAANIATGSMLTEMVKGMNVDDAEKLHITEISKKLDGLPSLKMHCAVLAHRTLKKAIGEYKKKGEGGKSAKKSA